MKVTAISTNNATQASACRFKGSSKANNKADDIIEKTKSTVSHILKPTNHKEAKTTAIAISVLTGLAAVTSLLAGKKQAWLGPILGAAATIFSAKFALDMGKQEDTKTQPANIQGAPAPTLLNTTAAK